ncbi:MAG: Uma2 family endonuclease [Chloroflexi bacterium]|nr:Uma2 family endonuclease [Chloroflexota bacterium]MCC6897113.1 Uma2 family endonuclease [Anaerolineae bacterium]
MFEAQAKPITFEEFLAFALLPENAGRNFEWINGEIIEKMPSSSRNSNSAFTLGHITQNYCETHELTCFISIGDGAYRIGSNTLAPDFAYKPTPTTDEYPDPEPPLWVAEIISPNDKLAEINAKRRKYIEAGILLWEVYPDERLIDVYAPEKPMATYGVSHSIPVDVIAGLTIDAAKLFR